MSPTPPTLPTPPTSPTPPPPTKAASHKKSLTALVVLNVALILGVAVITLAPAPEPAIAQGLGGGGSYTMLSATSTGVTQEQVIYVIDTRNYRVASLTFNSGTQQFRVIGGREILADFNPNNRRNRSR